MADKRPSLPGRGRRRRTRRRLRRQSAHRSDSDLQRLQDVDRLSSEWLWETDAGLRLTSVSPRIFDALGYRPFEVIGRLLDALVDFEDPDSVIAILSERRPFRDVPCQAITRSGEPRQFLLSGAPVFALDSGDFTGLRGLARDVTAARLAEHVTRRRDAILRAVVDAAVMWRPGAGLHAALSPLLARLGMAGKADRARLLKLESATGAGDACAFRVSAAWTDGDPASAGEGAGEPAGLFEDCVRSTVLQRLRDGDAVLMPPRRRHDDRDRTSEPRPNLVAVPVFVARAVWGALVLERWSTPASWSDEEVEAVRVAAALLATSLQREIAERALCESRALVQASVAMSGRATAVIRLRDGIVIHANDCFVAGTGCDRSSVIGTSLSQLSLVVDLEAARRLTRQLRLHGEFREREVAIRTADGSERIVSVSARAVALDGEPAAFVVAREMAEHRQAA